MLSTRSFLGAVAVTFSLILLSGGRVSAADGTIKGNITVNGKPLAAGKITFHLDNDQFVGAKVKNGSYTVDRVPVGTHRITVEGEGVPARYSSEDTTGLMAEVKEGANQFDVALQK
jgi:hypothetical protein